MKMFSELLVVYGLGDLLAFKAITSVRRPKMKRDAGVKCCLFTIKKTAFHSSVSLHFWATNGRYGFSKRQNHKDNFAHFCGLLRKAEL